ncbi:MAG: phage holin family protein [Sporolactobacillus sp.]
MNRYELLYRGVAAGTGALVGYLYGGWYPLLEILIALMIIDYVSGVLAAAYLGQLSSQVGFQGIAKKIMILLIVAVAHLVDRILNLDQIVLNAAVYFYLCNELLSIIENAGRVGLPIPDRLKSMISVLHGRVKTNDKN